MGSEPNRVDPIQGEIVHVYDGIEEADNELPRWWLMTFYLATAFAVVYWVTYHEFESAPLPAEEYASALLERSSGSDASEELLVALRDDSGAVAAGAGLFQEHCAVCHLERGQGNIGPNLTDDRWLHGGSPTEIYATIYDGALEAGMPAWGATLGGASAQRVAAFVLSIRNTNVEGKEPEGELYDPNATPSTDEPAEPGVEGSADDGPANEATGDATEEGPDATEEGPDATEEGPDAEAEEAIEDGANEGDPA